MADTTENKTESTKPAPALKQAETTTTAEADDQNQLFASFGVGDADSGAPDDTASFQISEGEIGNDAQIAADAAKKDTEGEADEKKSIDAKAASKAEKEKSEKTETTDDKTKDDAVIKAEEKTATDTDKSAVSDNDDDLPKGVKKRLARAARRQEDALARAEAAEKEAGELRSKVAEKAEFDAQKLQEPDPDDYADFEEYESAKNEYMCNKAVAVTAKEDAAKTKDNDTDSGNDYELLDAIDDIKDDVSKELFAKVGENKDMTITRSMVLAISESDDVEKVMNALAANPKLANEIAALPVHKQVLRIAKLDAAKPTESLTKNSNAPEPIDPVDGSDATKKSQDDMNFSEYEADRNKQEQSDPWSW